MKRDKNLLNMRAKFVQMAIQNPKTAAKELHLLADGLANTRTTVDQIKALSTIFCVSEKTITRDLINDNINN